MLYELYVNKVIIYQKTPMFSYGFSLRIKTKVFTTAHKAHPHLPDLLFPSAPPLCSTSWVLLKPALLLPPLPPLVPLPGLQGPAPTHPLP